jgi:FkbM family methyltransferase
MVGDHDVVEDGVQRRPLLRAVVEALPSFEKEMLLLSELVDEDAVCVDIGASYGLYSVALARVAGPGGLVVAIEPRQRSRAVLRTLCGFLAPGGVRILPVALAAKPGRGVLVTPRRWGGPVPVPGRSFLKRGAGGDGDGRHPGLSEEFSGAAEHETRIQTLDGIVRGLGLTRVDLVKVDVEGAELKVFEGGERTIADHKPVILCEIEDRHTRKYGHGAGAVLEWLRERGYEGYRFDGSELVPAPAIDPTEINYVFLPRRADPQV